MNIYSGFIRAFKALDRLKWLWIGFFIFKVIQLFPSGEEARWMQENGAYWRLAYKNCPPSWECLPTSIWGHLKDTSSLSAPFIEWLVIFVIGITVLEELNSILMSFLDDEELSIHE